ncbi:MAG: ABC-F family ATP-binding cassette domain-containing protein, partial [Blautia sp.]|nr:ABC-F family ATP-binding cassette domain-containing protein [Blautia sp.]
MILSCQNIGKSFGENEILRNASFHIEEREKAALIGNNGTGKTTLLRIIMKEISCDDGTVVVAKDTSLGYLAQYQDIHGHNTIYEELLTTKKHILDMESRLRTLEQEMKYASGDALDNLMTAYTRIDQQFEMENGYAYKSEVIGVLKGLGFEENDFSKPIETLSGGQKTRVALGKLLLTKPDILLLDEPTNHLDMDSITWLETYLLNYPGAVLIVSHDRYFLDKVVTKIIEIDNAQVMSYSGNYSSYALKKALLRDAMYKAYLNQQREIKHQEAVITKLRSFNREKSIKRAESREKMLNKLERIEKPVEIQNQMRLSLEPRFVSGNDVLSVEELSKSFPGQTLFTNVSFAVKRGERVALIGLNGTGKTTLLKIINGITDADHGKFTLGAKVQIGYYDQEHHVLHTEKSIFQEIADTYPTLTETQIRNMLAAFLFTGDDVFKEIASLSGG